jgi:hypothetical protein
MELICLSWTMNFSGKVNAFGVGLWSVNSLYCFATGNYFLGVVCFIAAIW